MKWKRPVLFPLVIVMFAAAGQTQITNKLGLKEQSLFSAEDETVERPVPVPKPILEILRKDEQVLRSLEADGKSPDELSPASFLASEIHLDGQDQIDLIVVGAGRLRGANVVTFWVFRKSPKGHKLVLKVAAHDLKIQSTRWKGYRIIEAASPIAGTAYTALYRFDGEQYRLYRSKSRPIS